MNITIEDLRNIDLNDILDEYENNEKIIEISDWNDKNIKLTFIAIFIILNNPRPRYNLKEKRLDSIRKEVSRIKLKILKNKISSINYDFFTLQMEEFNNKTSHELTIEGRLGVYASYFLTNTCKKDIEINDIRESKKKYMFQDKPYIINCSEGKKDEIEVVKDFLNQVKEEKDNFYNLYKKARNNNQNIKNSKIKPTNIDDSLKSILSQRLEEINSHILI